MEKKKIVIIVGSVILFLSAITFGICLLISSMQKDQKKTKEMIKTIASEYNDFIENAKLFNEKKEEYDALMENIYYINVHEKEEEIKKVLQEYDAVIAKIVENGKKLKSNCSHLFQDVDTNQRCESYQISYDSALEVFDADIKRYQTLVENYNAWTKENTNYQTITPYESKYAK